MEKSKTPSALKTSFDYIIIGAGSAGSVVAARLSEEPETPVLLLEAGPSDDVNPRIKVPAAAGTLAKTEIDWDFQFEPQKDACKAFKNNNWDLTSGKVLGGSSSLNYMAYYRGSASDYDMWESRGATGWGWEHVLPYFLRCEHNTDPKYAETECHNVNGPLMLSSHAWRTDVGKDFVRAGLELGYKEVDINSGNPIGFGDIQATIANGERCSSADAYLRPAMKRSNLTIVTNAYAKKIKVENKRAVGVEFLLNGVDTYVSAIREVVVSMGTLSSPKISYATSIEDMKS